MRTSRARAIVCDLFQESRYIAKPSIDGARCSGDERAAVAPLRVQAKNPSASVFLESTRRHTNQVVFLSCVLSNLAACFIDCHPSEKAGSRRGTIFYVYTNRRLRVRLHWVYVPLMVCAMCMYDVRA